jgi:hypothetical protein
MGKLAPAARNLGLWLLDREREQAATGEGEPSGLVAAAEEVSRKLGQPLGRLLGVDGYHALLKRALHLARAKHPLLEGVQVVADPVGGLDGLDAAVQGADPRRARDALAEALAQLIWLLVTFIGDDLTVRTVREVWPEVHLDALHLDDEAAPASREATKRYG